MPPTEPIFRPPSEADSLLLPVTVGCSHNRCSFCGMYRTKRYQVLELDGILADIEQARRWPGLRRAFLLDGILADIEQARRWPGLRRAFLLDGDALAAPTELLADVLRAIRGRLPWITRVGVYGDARSILEKGTADMSLLHGLGLGIVYHGLESGSEAVLQQVGKPLSRDQMHRVRQVMKASGVSHSVMALLGLGGTRLTDDHAAGTAAALTALDPDYIGLLTLMVVPGTPIAARQARGEFELPDSWGMLRELRTILDGLEVTGARLSANHASNFLPIKGDLPADKAGLLALVDRVLETGDEGLLRPEWCRGL